MKTKDNKVGVQQGEVDYNLLEVHVNMSNRIIAIIQCAQSSDVYGHVNRLSDK